MHQPMLPEPAARAICLVTGASSGIGAALAREFANHGHAVVLTARREEPLRALADEIAAAGHTRPEVVTADLGTAEGVAALAGELAARGLEPAYLVNNAGFGVFGEAADIPVEKQLKLIDVDVRAVTDLTLRYIGSVTRHQGGILNVASIAGFLPGPGLAAYHAAKAFVVSFTEALHQELKADGVRVCALCPGPVETGFFDQAGIPAGYFPAFLARSPERVARAAYEGLMAGHRVVVPGKPNRMVTLLPRLLPRGLIASAGGWRWRRAVGRGR
ncbi:MAG TPA: SDR family oxidoreductase [Pseudolabrys sp.]|nr:SDR family oxidoreductase [Pseudolabrys sp.]